MSKKQEEKLIDLMTDMMMHPLFHLPMKGYGFDENGTQVLIKEVHRRKEGCPECDKLYKDLPIPIHD